MSRFSGNLSKWLGVIPTCLVLSGFALLQTNGVFDSVDRRHADMLARVGPGAGLAPGATFPDVAVVTIDPRSLRKLR